MSAHMTPEGGVADVSDVTAVSVQDAAPPRSPVTLDTYLRTLPGRCGGCGFHTAVQGCRCAPVAPASEWSVFVTAITQAARDGEVHQSAVRPLIRGRIEPKHIGTLYRRAKAEGLLTDTGRREPSNDVAGRNSDKLDRIYALGGAS